MNQHITVQPLVYNGEVITQRDAMISLTDMWRAAGSPSGRAPADWLALVSSKEFVACVEASLNAGNPGIRARRGGGGGTFGNWQIGLAYAKYLSPEFHMWCNTVVRERMEGKSVSVATLPPDVLEMMRRIDGICRMSISKVTHLEKQLLDLAAALAGPRRHGKTAGEIWKSLGLPRLKNAPTWLGNKLEKMGCRVDGNGELGLTKARLFDPDKAEVWLRNGGSLVVKQKIAERQGQMKLRLVGETV